MLCWNTTRACSSQLPRPRSSILRNRERREDVSENLPSLKTSFTAAWEKQNAETRKTCQQRQTRASQRKPLSYIQTFPEVSKTSTHAGGPKHSLTSSVISRVFCLFTLMLEPISLFHKNLKLPSVPGLRLLYQYGLFSNKASYFFSFPNCCYIIYKEITFDLFVAYMPLTHWRYCKYLYI